jgi:hypothetical protein
MNIRCENCGQPALESDSTCWHCGEPLPGREQEQSEQVLAGERWGQTASPSTIGIYLASTIFVIVAALLLMRSIGDEPLVQVRLGTRQPAGWRIFTQADKLFTLDLPGDWRALDRTVPEEAAEIEALTASSDLFASALEPWNVEVDDLSMIFLAFGPDVPVELPIPFIVIGRSDTLSRLSYEGALQFLGGSDYAVREAELVDDYDKSHLRVVVDIPVVAGEADTLRCRQQFVRNRQDAVILAACVQASQFAVQEALFSSALTAFQWLAP